MDIYSRQSTNKFVIIYNQIAAIMIIEIAAKAAKHQGGNNHETQVNHKIHPETNGSFCSCGKHCRIRTYYS